LAWTTVSRVHSGIIQLPHTITSFIENKNRPTFLPDGCSFYYESSDRIVSMESMTGRRRKAALEPDAVCAIGSSAVGRYQV